MATGKWQIRRFQRLHSGLKTVHNHLNINHYSRESIRLRGNARHDSGPNYWRSAYPRAITERLWNCFVVGLAYT